MTNPDPAGLNQIIEIFTRVISISVGGAFIAVMVVLVWAGIKMITSGGDAKALGQASQTVTWALLGILFLALAWLILKLIEAFTGLPLTFFDVKVLCIPGLKGLAGCP